MDLFSGPAFMDALTATSNMDAFWVSAGGFCPAEDGAPAPGFRVSFVVGGRPGVPYGGLELLLQVAGA